MSLGGRRHGSARLASLTFGKAVTSPPAQKARPAPVSTTARIRYSPELSVPR